MKFVVRGSSLVVVATLLLTSWPAGAQTSGSVDDLVARAEAARASNSTDEAITLYRKALSARPRWAEGWWHLGTLHYDRDEFGEAAKAFRRATSLNPKGGTAWVMLGLCEYKLGSSEAALAHISRGRELGIDPDPQLRQVMLYHEGLLLLEKREFERAQETLAALSADGVESEELTRALGLSVLRLRASELPGDDVKRQQLVLKAGTAETMAARKQFEAAEREYERLAVEYTTHRHVHYAVGRHFVATQQPDKAVASFLRELENTPDHVPARLGIAAIKAETNPAAALPFAEEAVKLNPRIPLGHYVLGSVLLEINQVDRAIAELETALKSVRDDPGVYYALGRAYARAGRTQDAERARVRFKQLTDERQRAARRDKPGGTAR